MPNTLVSRTRVGARLLRRERRLVTVLLLSGVVLSLLVLGLLPDRYTATSSVMVTAAGGPDPTGATDLSMDTETEVVTSTPVVEAVRRDLGTTRTAAELAAATSVRVEDRGTILVISHEASSPEAARAGAAGFAQAYLRFRSEIVGRELEDRLSALEQQAETVRQQAADSRELLAGLPAGSIRSAELRQQLVQLDVEATRIEHQMIPLLSASTQTGSVVDRASLPTEPSGPARLRLALLFAGAVLAGTALLASWRDRRGGLLRDPEDLADDPEVDVTAVLPHDGLGVPGQDVRRLLRTLHAEAGDRLSILVVGASGAAPAWPVSRSLASASGRQHTPTVLAAAPGLVGAVGDAPDGVRVVHLAQDAEVTVDRVLQPHALPRLLARLSVPGAERSLDLVTTAPTADSDEAQALARLVDLVLVVAELDHTRTADLHATVGQLRQSGARAVRAVVVTPAPAPAAAPRRWPRPARPRLAKPRPAAPRPAAPRPAAPRRRRVPTAALVAGLGCLLVVTVVPIGWQRLGPGREEPRDGPGGGRAARAAAAASTPGHGLPGIHLSVRALPDGSLRVVEHVVARQPIGQVLLAPPAVPGRAVGARPRLADVRLRAPGTSSRLALVEAGGTDVRLRPRTRRVVLRYDVLGAASRDSQAPRGRAVLYLRPATVGTFGRLPVVTRLAADGTIHTLVCSEAPPTERLCGVDDGDAWHTRAVPASTAAFVALVDLVADAGRVG